jgi:hypothetical protein
MLPFPSLLLYLLNKENWGKTFYLNNLNTFKEEFLNNYIKLSIL